MNYESFSKKIERRNPTSICRFCLTENGLRRLQTKEIAQLFNQITHENLFVTANHPTFICTICEANLRLAAKISIDIQAIEKCWNRYIEGMHALEEVKIEFDDENVNFETVEMIIEPIDQMYDADFLDGDSKPEYEPHNYDVDDSFDNYDDSISGSNENQENDSPTKPSSSTKSNVCNRCNTAGLSLAELKEHQQSCHSETPQFACDICNARYSSRYGIHTHMKRHMQGSTDNSGSKIIKRYECDKCEERFSRKHDLTEHELRHAGGVLHVCHICGIAKKTKILMTNHLRSHESHNIGKKTPRIRSTKRYYTCWMCPTRIDFQTLDELKTHRKNLHHDFQCKFCKNGFMTNEALQSHMLIHGTQDRPHVCKFCGGTFAKIGHLKSHIQGKHAKQKPFPCEKCSKGFVHRYQLQAHIRIFHEKIKAFQCSECPASFGHAKSRVWHLRNIHKL